MNIKLSELPPILGAIETTLRPIRPTGVRTRAGNWYGQCYLIYARQRDDRHHDERKIKFWISDRLNIEHGRQVITIDLLDLQLLDRVTILFNNAFAEWHLSTTLWK